MSVGRQHSAPPRALATRARSLGRVVREIEPVLVRAALSAGLPMVRPRSAPERLAIEAHGFLALFTARRGATIERAVDVEMRRGAFAGCQTAGEAQRVLDVWRDVLRSFAQGHPGQVDGGALEAAVARIGRLVETAVPRIAATAIDVVAIGGSAGAIPAVGALLSRFDELTPATLLLVLHTHARAPMMMPLVLSRFTRLPLAYPVERGRLLLGHVYIAPPGRHLAVRAGRMRLLGTPPVCLCRPSIDVLFASAAASFGPRLASLLLSGSGRDGAEGTQEVRARGGATFAQSPADAEHGIMPAAAIATGAVQFVAPIAALAQELGRQIAEGRHAVL
jgi:two-component system chemotaxis response regulator CheB